jgi:hypothetical protein
LLLHISVLGHNNTKDGIDKLILNNQTIIMEKIKSFDKKTPLYKILSTITPNTTFLCKSSNMDKYGILSRSTGDTFIPNSNDMMEPKQFLLYIADELHTLQETLKGDPKFRNESSPDLTQENQYSTANIFN